MTKRILISGVAGFIGTNLANRFLAEDNIVVGLDNFSLGDTNETRWRIRPTHSQGKNQA
jgi:nucleoside-diphosphate-sugar epimerase